MTTPRPVVASREKAVPDDSSLSRRPRIATKALHMAAERSGIMKRIARGEISRAGDASVRRRELDRAVTSGMSDRVIAEAKTAFALHEQLFRELEQDWNASGHRSTDSL